MSQFMEVLEWFDDPVTAPSRRANAVQYWTRTGAPAIWDYIYYDLSAYYVLPTSGDFATGAWITDAKGIVPVINIDADTPAVLQPDGRYKVIHP